MKKVSVLVLMLMLIGTAISWGQQLSPKVTVKGDNISVTYGQPSKRDRVIFGELVPYNEIWRTGANDATEVTLQKDAKIGDKKVKAGTYTLFTVPGEKEWTVILNSQLGQWGTYEYDKHKAKDVAVIKVPSYTLKEPVEKMTITPKNDALTIEWDKTGVSIPVKM